MNSIDYDKLINEVLKKGSIYVLVDFDKTDETGVGIIKETKVYALTTKRISPDEIVSYFETEDGDFGLYDYDLWWWVKKPGEPDTESSVDIVELAQAIIDSNIEVSYVDRLYWVEKDSAVKQLAKYIIEQGWHK